MSAAVMVTLASATAMGQQEYELQLALRLPALLPHFRQVQVRSWRSQLPGQARAPLAVVGRLPPAGQHAVARTLYGPGLIHRCDLRLPAGRREVVTVHDLAPWRFDDEGQVPPRAAQTLRAARAVICPSRFAADELAAILDIHAEVVPNGLDPSVWTADPRAADAMALPEAFVLHSGGATARKNLAALAQAWPAVRATVPAAGLVLCGPPHPDRDRLFHDLPGVVILGRVDRATHLALMSRASVVVVPSRYEGFGFPALEAMARGTAVVAAERGSLPEICGDAALLCAPSGEGLARALAEVLTNAELRDRLSGAGPDHARPFSWDQSAARHADILREAAR